MKKNELIETIVEKTDLSKKQVTNVLDAMTATITEQLIAENDVTLTSFGTFLSKHRKARMGVNPQNPSEKMKIPAVTIPKFKAGKGLKDALKGERNDAPPAKNIAA